MTDYKLEVDGVEVYWHPQERLLQLLTGNALMGMRFTSEQLQNFIEMIVSAVPVEKKDNE